MHREIPRDTLPEELNDYVIEALSDLFFGPDSSYEEVDILFVFGVVKLASNAVEIVQGVLDQELTKKVMLTGGMPVYTDSYQGYSEAESESLLKMIDQRKYAEVEFLFETNSSNTLENVTEALNVYDFSHLSKVAFTSKKIHSLRSYLTLKKFVNAKILSWPYSSIDTDTGSALRRDNWFKTTIGIQKVWGEYLRIKLYGSRGDIAYDEVQGKIELIEKLLVS